MPFDQDSSILLWSRWSSVCSRHSHSKAPLMLIPDTLRLALLARWSAQDSIKPVFSYLISALCQGKA